MRSFKSLHFVFFLRGFFYLGWSKWSNLAAFEFVAVDLEISDFLFLAKFHLELAYFNLCLKSSLLDFRK